MLDSIKQLAAAAEYQLLTPLPGITTREGVDKFGSTTYFTDFTAYIPALVKLVIGLAGGAAVLMIIFGGIQYMSTDAFSGKSSAKETIQNALIGLLLAMSSWIILYTVNPKLVDINISLQGVGSTNPLGTGLGGAGGICTDTSPCTQGTALTCVAANCSGGYTRQECSESSPCKSGTLMCTDCEAIMPLNPSFPAKRPSDNGCLAPGPCQVHEKLEEYLINIASELKQADVPWQVTEMYPPTVPHIDICHREGRCVDAAIIYPSGTPGPNSAYIQKILTVLDNYLSNKKQPGISYEYEICPESRRVNFLTATAGNKVIQDHASRFKCEATTTGENFHIELNNRTTY